jgi:toxin-antitoxin system PIN domain toxin
VIVYAIHDGTPDHPRYRAWLESVLASGDPVGLSDLALSGFVRIVTNPRIFAPPATPLVALDAVDALRAQPNVTIVAPRDRHWQTFRRLCLAAGAKGNLVADAFHAALAIESGAEFITTDRDFSRFPGLRWRHPLEDPA